MMTTSTSTTESSANASTAKPKSDSSAMLSLVDELKSLSNDSKEFTIAESKALEMTAMIGSLQAETLFPKSGAKVKSLLSDIVEALKKDQQALEKGGIDNILECLKNLDIGVKDERPQLLIWEQIHSSYMLLEVSYPLLRYSVN